MARMPASRKTAEGKHVLQPLRPILAHLFAMIVHVRREGRRDDAEVLHPLHEIGVDQGAVFDAEAGVFSRFLPLQPFVQFQHDVDTHIAIGVNSDLPVGVMGLLCVDIKLILIIDQDSIVIWSS